VVGSVARALGQLVLPIFLLLALVLSIAALAAGDGDADDFDLDVDSEGWESTPPMAAEERHAADVALGKGVVVFFVTLCVAGAGIWWWVR